MTNKQIIINEVDVSWCEWIREIELDSEYICTCNSLNKTSSYCKDNPNCYYKQLKEKEKECEELEKLYKELQDDMLSCNKCRATIKLQQQLDQLKQTIAEIKELIQSDYCTEIGSCEFCAEIGNCLNRKIIHKISECEETK